ncbi:hypothetical protein EMCRGX_G021470 [Ephydatia muelleri]
MEVWLSSLHPQFEIRSSDKEQSVLYVAGERVIELSEVHTIGTLSSEWLRYTNGTLALETTGAQTTTISVPSVSRLAVLAYGNAAPVLFEQSAPVTIRGGGQLYLGNQGAFYCANNDVNTAIGRHLIAEVVATATSLSLFSIALSDSGSEEGTIVRLSFNGTNVLNLRGSAMTTLLPGSMITYLDGTLSIQKEGLPVQTRGGVVSFLLFDGLQLLNYSWSGPSVIVPGGSLYIDSRTAFYTESTLLMAQIASIVGLRNAGSDYSLTPQKTCQCLELIIAPTLTTPTDTPPQVASLFPGDRGQGSVAMGYNNAARVSCDSTHVSCDPTHVSCGSGTCTCTCNLQPLSSAQEHKGLKDEQEKDIPPVVPSATADGVVALHATPPHAGHATHPHAGHATPPHAGQVTGRGHRSSTSDGTPVTWITPVEGTVQFELAVTSSSGELVLYHNGSEVLDLTRARRISVPPDCSVAFDGSSLQVTSSWGRILYWYSNVASLVVFEDTPMPPGGPSSILPLSGGGQLFVDADTAFYSLSDPLSMRLLLQAGLPSLSSAPLLSFQYTITSSGFLVSLLARGSELVSLDDLSVTEGNSTSSFPDVESLSVTDGVNLWSYGNIQLSVEPGLLLVWEGGALYSSSSGLNEHISQLILNAQMSVSCISTMATVQEGVVSVLLRGNPVAQIKPENGDVCLSVAANQSFSLANGSLFDTVSDGFAFRGVRSVKTLTNCTLRTVYQSNATFVGPGELCVTTTGGGVFFFVLPSLSSLHSAYLHVVDRFQAPSLAVPSFPSTFVSTSGSIVSIGQSVGVFAGLHLTLLCAVTRGNPLPNIQWTLKGNLLGGGTGDKHAIDGFQGTMTIFGVDHSDAGEYKCTATNIKGSAQAQSVLTVLAAEVSCIYADSYSPCSAACGVGVQQRAVLCQRVFNGTTFPVDPHSLPISQRPAPSIRMCLSNQMCPTQSYAFRVGDYGRCSASCQGGRQSRSVSCMELYSGTPVREVGSLVCTLAGLEAPPTHRLCNMGACPVWLSGAYGNCSVRCGNGVRTRTLVCLDALEDAILNDTACNSGTKPDISEACIGTECEYQWSASEWGKCATDCLQTRAVVCVEASSRTEVDTTYCQRLHDPPFNQQPCDNGDSAVLAIASSQGLQFVFLTGPTLDFVINNARVVTLAPCGTAITINASNSISYLNNVIYISTGFNAPEITQFNTLNSATGLTAVSDGGQLLGVTGKLYVQVPLALFVATSIGLIGNIDSAISSFALSLPTFTTSIQGTYITLQSVPITAQDFRSEWRQLHERWDFGSVRHQRGLALSDTRSTKRFFINNQDLINQVNEAYTKSIFDTFQFRYTGVAGTGTAYLTSKGSDLTILTGSVSLDFPDISGVSYKDDVVTFVGAGTPTFTGVNYLSIFDGLKGLESRIRGGPGAIQRSFSTIPGRVILGENTIFYTTFQPVIDYISGDTNLALVVNGTHVAVTRGNVEYVTTTSGSSYSIASGAQVLYTGNTLQIANIDSLSGIKKLTTLQGGVLATSFLPTSTITLYGPGLLLYGANAAFYTTDQTLQNQFSRSVFNMLAGALGFSYSAPAGTTNLISSTTDTTLLTLSNGPVLSGITSFSFLDGTNTAVTTATQGISYPISGDGSLYTSGTNAFYSTSGQLDSFLSPPYTISQTLQGTSLTVQRGTNPLITSSTVYSVPAGSSLGYSNNAVTVTDAAGAALFTAAPITSLATVNNQKLVTALSSLTSPLSIPGFLVYNVSTGAAFYTTDATQIGNIQSAYDQVLSNTFAFSYITTPSGGTATVLTTEGGTSLLQTTGASSLPVDPSAVQAVYQGDTLSFLSGDGAVVAALPGINTFSYFNGPGVVTLNVPGTGQVVPVQGGQVFFNQGKAFYTASQKVIDYVNSIPAISYSVNGNQLVVTNGNAPVGTFSQLYSVPAGGNLEYSSGQLVISAAPMGMGMGTTITLSGSYPTLTTFDGTAFATTPSSEVSRSFQGPGQLYYNQGQQQAHYLTSPALVSTLSDLSQTAYRKVFTFGYNSVRGTTKTTLFSTGVSAGGQTTGVQSIVPLTSSSPSANVPSSVNSLTFQNNVVSFSGSDPTATYPSFPASSLFVYNNTLSPVKQQNGSLAIQGGGSVYTDGTSVFYTAHQQLNGFLAAGVASAPAPSLTYFQVTRDPDTGAASLLADGLNVLTLTGAASQFVPYGSTITYSGGTVNVRSASGQTLLTVPSQSQLTVVDTNGVKTTVYSGSFPSTLPKLLVSAVMGGKVYFNSPQTFFTTYSAVINTVDQAILNPTTPSFQVVIKNGTRTVVGGTARNGVVTLTAGPGQKTVFPLSGAQTVSTQSGVVNVLYTNNIISAISRWVVLSGNPTYTGTTNPTSITYGGGVTISPVTSLKVYDGVTLSDVTGGSSVPLTTGGTLYQSSTGDSLYINPLVVNIPSNVASELLRRSVPYYSQDNINSLQVFDGRQLLTFSGSAPYLLNGGGTYYNSGGQVFFTSSKALQQTITTQSSLLSSYNTTVVGGRYYIVTNGLPVFSFDALAKLIPLQTGDTVSYSGGTVYNGTAIIPGLPIAASSLTVDTGFGTATYNLSSPFPLSGPGFLVVTPSPASGVAGNAFLSLSPSLTRQLTSAQAILTANYRPSVIAAPRSLHFASHYQIVAPPYSFPQFGQEIRVFEDADVFINCTVTDGNPPPTITFSKLNGTQWLDLTSANVPLDYVLGPTYLRITAVTLDDGGVFRCTAKNAAGFATQQSILSVKPAAAPFVGSAFLLSKVQPGQQVSQYLVNCKVRVDPKQGTGYLNVSVSSTDAPSCTTYTCLANNVAGTSSGSVTVCTQRYTCNSTGIFNPCSVTCGLAGYRVEILDCHFENSTSRVPIVYANIPTGYIQNTPQVSLGCGQGDCPVTTYQYEVSDFGSCSATCGGGLQTRSFFCVQLVSRTGSITNKTVANNTLCLLAGRKSNTSVSLVRPCNTQACPAWSVGSYGACSVTCGAGIQIRTVQCRDSSGAILNDSACIGQVRPTDTAPCQQPPCPFAWTFSAWGPCTPDCFVGVQTRSSVLCVKPPDTNRCGFGPCPGVGLWLTTSTFSTCIANNGTCGNGLQSRNVTCVDINNSNTPSIYCNPDTKPSVTQNCFVTCPSCNSEPFYCPMVPTLFCPKVSILCCKSCPQVPSPTPTTTGVPQPTATPL